MIRTVLAVALLVGFAAPAAAGPVAVFTQVREVASSGSDELYLDGLGNVAVLTTGGGVNPVVTVPADQTSGSQLVVGFWPLISFSDRAQYEAERGTILTIPETPVTLYAEVWNGEYGAGDVRTVHIDAVISGTFGADIGQNSLDWRFVNPPVQIDFGPMVVTLSYTPVKMPDAVPHIRFADGSPPIGFPGPHYYPTLLEAQVSVQRAPSEPSDPGDPPGGEPTDPGGDPNGNPTDPDTPPGDPVPGVPEPTSALLLAGLAAGGFAGRLRATRK